jgi:hypothetical protein
MTAFFGNTPEPPVGPETAAAKPVAPARPTEAAPRKPYCKPALKHLGWLRSVTGSDRMW